MILIDMQKIRDGRMSSQEWNHLKNAVGEGNSMTEQELDADPEFKKWYKEVMQIAQEKKGQKIHLDDCPLGK